MDGWMDGGAGYLINKAQCGAPAEEEKPCLSPRLGDCSFMHEI